MKREKEGKSKEKNQMEISFRIAEELYGEFKLACKEEKLLPATVMKRMMRNYIEERKGNYQ